MALYLLISVSSTDQTLNTLLLVLDSARQHTAISRFHVPRPNWWSRVYSRRTSVMEQTTSDNPVIGHSAEFHEPIESSLLLIDHFFFFSTDLKHGRPWIGLHVTTPKKLTFYDDDDDDDYYYYTPFVTSTITLTLTLTDIISTHMCDRETLWIQVDTDIVQSRDDSCLHSYRHSDANSWDHSVQLDRHVDTQSQASQLHIDTHLSLGYSDHHVDRDRSESIQHRTGLQHSLYSHTVTTYKKMRDSSYRTALRITFPSSQFFH